MSTNDTKLKPVGWNAGKRKDIIKQFVCYLTQGYKMYHVINAAGIAFTTISDRTGQVFSCYRDQEDEMLEKLGLQKK